MPRSRSTNPLRESDFPKWKSRQLRSSFLTRLKKLDKSNYESRKGEVPTAVEIEAWLIKAEPYKCFYSGDDVPRDSLEVDHATPVSREGSFAFKNLKIASKLHNRCKGDLTAKEYKALLRIMSKWESKAYWSVMNRLIQSTFIYRKRRR